MPQQKNSRKVWVSKIHIKFVSFYYTDSIILFYYIKLYVLYSLLPKFISHHLGLANKASYQCRLILISWEKVVLLDIDFTYIVVWVDVATKLSFYFKLYVNNTTTTTNNKKSGNNEWWADPSFNFNKDYVPMNVLPTASDQLLNSLNPIDKSSTSIEHEEINSLWKLTGFHPPHKTRSYGLPIKPTIDKWIFKNGHRLCRNMQVHLENVETMKNVWKLRSCSPSICSQSFDKHPEKNFWWGLILVKLWNEDFA